MDRTGESQPCPARLPAAPVGSRSDWTNLNGLWDYAIAPKDPPGLTHTKAASGSISVESALSGVKRAVTPAQRLWYRRTFSAPALGGKRLLLHFGAVDWRAEVWVNGKSKWASIKGGYDPFTFDITDALKPGRPRRSSFRSGTPPTPALSRAASRCSIRRHLVHRRLPASGRRSGSSRCPRRISTASSSFPTWTASGSTSPFGSQLRTSFESTATLADGTASRGRSQAS